MKTIDFTDDGHRPVDAYGYLVPPTIKTITINKVNGASYTSVGNVAWYTTLRCDFTENSSSANPTIGITNQFDATTQTGVFDGWVRVRYEISTNNFQTILQSGYIKCGNESKTDESGYFQSGQYQTWTYYARGNTSLSDNIQLHYFDWCATTVNLTVPEGAEYKVRLTAMTKAGKNGQWQDISNAVKVYTSVMPMSNLPTITYPSTVYMNQVNTFGMHIDQKYTTSFAVNSAVGNNTDSNGYHKNYASEMQTVPVRNEQSPYITSGTTTEVLYWYPQIPRNNIRNSDTSVSYVIRCTLSVVDPGDTNYMIDVCQNNISGTAVWASQDDTSALSATYTVVETPSTINQYGALIRNIDQTLKISVSVVAKYGIYFWSYYQSFYDSSYAGRIYIVSNEQQSGTYESVIRIESGTQSTLSTTLVVGTNGYNAINQSLTFNVMDYYVPSFPNLAVHRCDENGYENDSGDHCKIEWSVSIVPLGNHNSKSLTIVHPEGTTVYDPLNSYYQSGVLIVSANTESSYNIIFTLTDDMNSEKRTIVLSSAGVIMDWLRGGRGVSFGKVASKTSAVEVGEMWKLICYKLLLSGTDINEWMKEVIARLNGIEQFASNLGSTSQYQVTFYNDYKILNRQWVRTGNNATDPGLTPEKEPTNTTSYSFVGWALTNGATSANPNALTNITSYRSIYAAFASTTRYYAVFYYNGGNLLQTVNNVQFHGSASYTGSTPTSDNGTFVGWMKSGLYVEKNAEAYAQFYDDTEITDSWGDIVRSCADGSYIEKYKQGNWKMLDLGTYGNIKMRIKGIKMHYGPGMKKNPITWEADTKLSTNYRMNPLPSYVYGEQVVEGFKFDRFKGLFVEGSYEYYYLSTVNAPGSDRKATASFTITAKRACSCSLLVKVISPGGYSGTSVWHIDTTMNGETRQTDARPTSSETSVGGKSLAAGETITYTIEAYKNLDNYNAISNTYLQLRFYSDPDEYVVGNGSLNISMSTNMVDGVVGVESGTGISGGFEASELYATLQNNVKDAFPAELKSGLKRTRVLTRSAKSSTEYPFVEYLPNEYINVDLFIPCSDEIVGAYDGITEGVDFNVLKYQYRKKGNTLSASSYWCRDVSGSTYYYATIYGYQYTDGNAYRASGICSGTKPVYICFCT